MTNEQMWEIYAQGVAQAAGFPNSPDGFILTGDTLIANFATSSTALPVPPTTADALYQIYGLGDTELSLAGIYSPVGQSFFSDYATYIDNLVPVGSQKSPTPSQSAQIKLFQDTLTKANAKLENDYNSAAADWNSQSKLFPGQYPSFQSFLNQSTWGASIDTDISDIAGTNSKLSTLLTIIYGQDYVAIAQNRAIVDNVRTALTGSASTGPADMLVNATSGTLVVPTYNPSSLETFSAWVDTAISQHGSGQAPISITYSTSSGEFDFSKSTYFSQTSWSTDYFFFSEGGSSSSSSQQVNVNTSASEFSLTMTFDAITQMPIERGPWYDSSLMGSFPNPNKLSTPTNLIIAMYPSLTLTMDQASFTAAQNAYNTSSGFGVGVFWVSSAGNSQSSSSLQMTANWSKNSNSVTISSQSILPVIVALQVEQVS